MSFHGLGLGSARVGNLGLLVLWRLRRSVDYALLKHHFLFCARSNSSTPRHKLVRASQRPATDNLRRYAQVNDETAESATERQGTVGLTRLVVP